MKPSTFHRFSLPRYNVIIELHWRNRKPDLRERFLARIQRMLIGGIDRASPAHLVPARKFEEAVELLESDGIKAAYEIFDDLGYDIVYKQKEAQVDTHA